MPPNETGFQLFACRVNRCSVLRIGCGDAARDVEQVLRSEHVPPGLSGPQWRRLLTDWIGPFDRIELGLPLCLSVADFLVQTRTALLKLARPDTELVLLTEAGLPADALSHAELAVAWRELVMGVRALGRIIRPRAQDALRIRWQAHEAEAPSVPPQRFAVVGAGIAGVTIALELQARGKYVTLIEAREDILREGSGQKTLVCHPQFSRDHDLLSQLSQYALRATLSSPYAGLFSRVGRFTPALSPAHAAGQQALAEAFAADPGMLRFISSDEARQLAQWPPTGTSPDETNGGLWTALGATLPVEALRDLVAGLAARATGRFQVLTGRPAGGFEACANQWRITLSPPMRSSQPPPEPGTDEIIADALVLACGCASPAMLRRHASGLETGSGIAVGLGAGMRWDETGGQTFLAESLDPAMPEAAATIGGAVTLQRLGQSQVVLGSSYYEPDTAPPDHAQWSNLLGKLSSLPAMAGARFELTGMQPGLRCYMPDRLPLIGPLSAPGLDRATKPLTYLASAFGSRGLLWAHLAATLIADHAEGKAPAIGMKALKSIDALRYLAKTATGTID